MTGRRVGRLMVFIAVFLSFNCAVIFLAVREYVTGAFFVLVVVLGLGALYLSSRDTRTPTKHRRRT